MNQQSELINAIDAFILTGVSVFMYLKTKESAARLYKLQSNTRDKTDDADIWIKRKTSVLRTFYGCGAVLMSAIA